MVKFSIFLRKRADINQTDFVDYHKTQHAPLFTSLPEVKQYVHKYVQSHAVPVALPGFPDTYYNGITELWFDDVASIGKVFGSTQYLAIVRPDEEKFLALNECGFLITTENHVM
ncbi:EthD domain-containing protein [Adhaeribacter pallidiroseus]|uniref:EthD domain-containing protein n=1 Tax=Adhaeribacter pallidiroseus TaxID=2072847 RepID=A0A369QBZ9_9BACT|nr:EthD domain-containing protein [Adhaeribacter pallidiroseus]RDC62421.1 hypothetical protein AHMF7616_01015 [Adhaeribacter pallidiroseus]